MRNPWTAVRAGKLMLSGLLVLALFLLRGPTALASGTWYVNGVTGSDSNNCQTRRTPCKTIGHAISLAASGDSISVAAATYTENLTIPKSLTITGAGRDTTIIDGGQAGTAVEIESKIVVSLSGVTVQNGYPRHLSGSGIANYGTLLLSHCTVRANKAAHFGGGGGIQNHATAVISHCDISENTAEGYGGGIFNDYGSLTVSDSSITRNRANGISGLGGGGIFDDGGTLTVIRTTIAFNYSVAGGGIDDWTADVTITNSTLSENRASGPRGGGGVATGAFFNPTVTINNSTLSGNSAPSDAGGGIAAHAGSVMLQNTIVANSPSGGNCNINAGSLTSNGYNLSSDTTCPFNNIGDLNNTDPTLGPLQKNGGPTQTQALLSGSPAIDAGNPSGCKDSNGNLLTTDQRGYPRPDLEDVGVGCDLGAYELQNAP